MKRLFEIELIKLKNSRTTKIIFIIYAVITILGLLIFGDILAETGSDMEALPPFSFPIVWFTGSLVSTYLVIFPTILAILHAGNEFSSKIHRQHIIDGLSKNEYVISKLFSILIISLVCTLYTAFLCLVVGLLNNSKTFSQAEMNLVLEIFGDTLPILWIIGYFIYTFSILSFALLVTFIFKKTGRSIYAFISYFFILEWVLRWVLGSSLIAKFLPIWSVANNIFPNITEAAAGAHYKENLYQESDILAFDWNATLLAIVYIGIYFLIIKWVFLKRDL